MHLFSEFCISQSLLDIADNGYRLPLPGRTTNWAGSVHGWRT